MVLKRSHLVIVALWIIFCTGRVCCTEFTESGTLFYNFTGTLNTQVEEMRDIFDHESHCYGEIVGNLSRWFQQLFEYETPIFSYNVTVVTVFIWPTSGKVENNHHDACNFSFAMIAKYTYRTTPHGVPWAEQFLKVYVHEKLGFMPTTPAGYIVVEALKIEGSSLDVQEIPRNELNMTLNILNNYMQFLTKLTNDRKVNPGHSESKEPLAIAIISYVGISFSVVGLLVTLISICFFRKLRKFRGNQILVNICVTVMAGMLLSVVSFTYKGGKEICKTIAISLHYFILSAVCWMCVEAHNLYRDLVKVFNTNVLSSRTFFLRAFLFAYGIPAVIVGVVTSIDLDIYGLKLNDSCWMSSLAVLVSFLAPVLLIVLINIVFFVLIMREIVQVSQRDAHTIRPSLRAAISLSVLLGFCWLFAAVSTFSSLAFFQYAFVIMSSFQGFFIFLFHGIGKKELRDSWKSLGIFNWKLYGASGTESQGRVKTESTQDINPPISMRQPGTNEGNPENGSKKFQPRCGATRDARVIVEAENADGRNKVKRSSCDLLLSKAEEIVKETLQATKISSKQIDDLGKKNNEGVSSKFAEEGTQEDDKKKLTLLGELNTAADVTV